MDNTRFIALKALLKVEKEKAYSNIVLDKVLNEETVSKRDSAFVCNLVYGVLERKIQLDYIISLYSKIPIHKISDDILNILRIGIYQLLFMDKVPHSAAVNESVNLSRKCKKKSACGFINVVLRNVSRNKDSVLEPKEIKDSLEYLKIKYSCPIEIIKLWEKSYGLDCTKNLLESSIEKPKLIIRVNTLKNSSDQLIDMLKNEDIKASYVDKWENCLILNGVGSIALTNAFKEGRFHIQDLASQILCEFLFPKEGDVVIDLCSAPGGKAFTLAEIMNNNGKILAFDLYDHKIKLINDGAERLGIDIIESKIRDALTKENDLEKADKVLCDVPCSGLGIIKRKPEIKYKKLDDFRGLPDLQYDILCNSEKFTKIGGILMYSTCTLNPSENGEIADKFLEEHSNYEPYELKSEKIERCLKEPLHQVTFMPHMHNTDGFFIAAFKRIR